MTAVDGFAAALEDARTEADRLDAMARMGHVPKLTPIVDRLHSALTAMAVSVEAEREAELAVRVLADRERESRS